MSTAYRLLNDLPKLTLTIMKLIHHTGPIEDFNADALVYSTNQQLHLTGGVGAALVSKWGPRVQHFLDERRSEYPSGIVPVGTVIDGAIEGLPYRRIFHSVATSTDYETSVDTVRRIIQYCWEECDIDFSISTVAFSALGSGYGDMHYDEFSSILDTELRAYSASSFKVVLVNKV